MFVAVLLIVALGLAPAPAPAPALAPAPVAVLTPGPVRAAPRVANPSQQVPQGGARRDIPPTQFAAELSDAGLLMVVASAEAVTRFGIGTAVVRLRVDEHLLGDGPGDGETIVLLAFAREFHVGSKALLVLEPFGEGGRYRVRHRIDTRDTDFVAKLAMSRRQVGIMELPTQPMREDGVFQLIESSLDSPDAWTRRYALSELIWLSTVYPDLLTDERMHRLRTVAIMSRWPEVTDGVESVAIERARRTEALRARTDKESSSP